MITDAQIARDLKKFDDATTKRKFAALLKDKDLLTRFVMHDTVKIYYDTMQARKKKRGAR